MLYLLKQEFNLQINNINLRKDFKHL
jgi:hypothetical protein